MYDANKAMRLRKSLGWTQEEAARKSGYSERLIRKIERGESVRKRSLNEVLTAYHVALGIDQWSLDEFIRCDEQPAACEDDSELNEQRVAEYFEVVFNQRQLSRIEDYISPDIVFTGEGRTARGIEVIRNRAKALLDAFSPLEHTIERIYSKESKVHCFWSVRMKHVGEFLGIPASGRWVTARGNSIAAMKDGLVTEVEDQWDVDFVIRQLKGEGPTII